MEFNDWSAHMQQVELHTKRIEHKLLHKDYNGMGTHIDAIKTALDKTQAWVAMQGQNANVDVVPVIQRVLDAIPEKDFSRPYLMVAIQEIQQLRGERQFWLQSGYEIGNAEQK